jgi:hypothetical protein
MQELFRNIKQGFETNKKRLTFIKSERSSKLRSSMRLVVAIRLQAQYSSFWLRTSSNTPSVLMNDAHGSFANSAFHLVTFVLRSAWATGTIQDNVAIWKSLSTSHD